MEKRCDFHDEIMDGIKSSIIQIFEKLEKADGRFTTLIIVVIVLAFFAGANTARGILEFALKLAQG